MSDLLSPAAPISAALQSPGNTPPPPPRHGVRCPRCGSNNTKFCYYNNYSTAQPRHYCKSCRRYWTEGGSLRNIPIGGATSCRKNKRPRVSSPGETSDDGGGGGVFMIPQAPPPPVDHFQLAGNLYPPNLSPFGDHLLFRAPPPLPSGSPLDLLEGLNFNSPLINNSAGGGSGGGGFIEYSLINYSLNQQQQQHRMDLLYGGVSGGGEIAQMNTILNNKDKNYQNEEEDIKNVRVVGPTDDVMNLFGNSSTKTQPKYEYSHSHDQSVAGNYEDHESPAASASNRWLFTGASSSNSAINGNKNNINNNNHERSDGNATSSSLKRWMSW